MTITTAMVLAAGLGTRMRPLTNDRPKALVNVGGKALIDHVLDRLIAGGITRAVVNVHAFADMLEAHVKKRRDMEIVISDERALLMETGGGVKQARALLGDGPIVVANIDSVWEEQTSAVARLIAAYDPSRMSALLMLAAMNNCVGFETPGDFHMDAQGQLAWRGAAARSDWAFMGVQVMDPTLVDGEPLEPFSLRRAWDRALAGGRFYGLPLNGFWMHVGDPAAREAAEARLAGAAARA
ncbi:MAG: nucleotidyltransferase family protein [Hyphomonadaceae bacterium]